MCGADNYKIVYPAKDIQAKGRVYSASSTNINTDQIVKCKNCGLMYVNPIRPHKEIIEEYATGSDETFISQNDARVDTFKKYLKILDSKFPKKGKVLDIGTAGGAFLKAVKEDGWDCEGIEPNRWMAEWAMKRYGVKIHIGTLDDFKGKNEAYDVITLWDVLEHVPNPMNTLEKCNSLLKKEGLLIVNYPDIGSIISKIMRSKWVFLLSVHLYYFDRKTIREYLKKTKFDVLEIKPHFQKLELGYLAQRISPYNKTISKIVTKAVGTAGLSKVQIPYWLGQTLVIAKKK